MYIIVVFIVLAILVILLAIRYLRINADVLSREEFKIAADKRAEKLDRADPFITCDYCGTVIDTRIHRKCPNCGASYGEDKQWENRHNADQAWIDENARMTSNMQKRKAAATASQKTKALRYVIVVFVCLCVMTAVMIFASQYFHRSESRKDESVNENEYEHYVRANYHVLNNSTILDHDGFTIRITGFYQDKRGNTYSPIKIEFTVENNTSEKQRISISSVGINGLAGQTYLFVYDVFDPGTTVFYEKLYFVPENMISEIVFDHISLYKNDVYSNIYTVPEPVKIKTSAVLTEDKIQPEGNLIYTNEMVDVYSQDSENHSGYRLWIQNKSANDLIVEGRDLRIDGEKLDHAGLYKKTIPGEYLFYESSIRTYDEAFEGYENKKVELSLSFHCEKDPALDFSTGYIELK